MRIGRKIQLFVLAGALTILLVVSGSVFALLQHEHAVREIVSKELKFRDIVSDSLEHLYKLRKSEKNFLLFHEEEYLKSLKEEMVNIEKNLSLLKDGVASPSFKWQVVDILAFFGQYRALLDTIEGVSQKGYLRFTEKARDLSGEMENVLEKGGRSASENILGGLYEQIRIQRFHIFLVITAAITSMLALMFGGAVCWRGISRRIDKLNAASKHVMIGEYHPIMDDGPIDEIGEVIMAFNEMQQRIAERETRLEKLNAEFMRQSNQLKLQR